MPPIEVPELFLELPAISLDTTFDTLGLDREECLKGFSIETSQRFVAAYQQQVQAWVSSKCLNTSEPLHAVVEFALRVFHCENVTGELSDAESELICDPLARFHFGDEIENRFVQRLLMIDGEMPSVSIRYVALLLAALAVVRCKTADSAAHDLFTSENVWRFRAVFRHQLCLLRRSHSLFHELATTIEAVERLGEEERTPELLLELGHVQNYYHRRDLAAQYFLKAMQKSGLQIEESAIRGVRTRWQQHQVVQAVVNAASARAVSPVDPQLDQPVEVGGEKAGHDLLDRPRMAPESEPAHSEEGSAAVAAAASTVSLKPLAAIDKAIILALAEQIHYENAHHGLTKHHMQIYLERLAVDPVTSPYVIRSQILLARARLEHGRSRVAERAFLQVHELVDQYSAKTNPNVTKWHRSDPKYFYLVAYPAIWKLKRELATLCFEENLHKTALDLYEQIQDWEKIIECCKALDKRKKAENLALELIEKDPKNPLLWVALGEATREDCHLWKAWELSGKKMAAPMRALAKLALEREHYDKVVDYFYESVKINPVFGGDWFTLGYASMRLKDYNRSGEAFTRACQIDPNDAFAWNNLASIMLQQERFRPAFNAMSQALRNNRRSWRMWQNYFSIGVELLEVTESTHAITIALEIAQRNLPLEAESMKRFVDMAIRYMKGDIRGTDNKTASEEVADEQLGAALPHTNLAADEESSAAIDAAEMELTDLRPFADDVEVPETYFPAKVAAEAESRERMRYGIASRYAQRVKDLLHNILELFVTDPEIYHCAAELHRYLSGPLVAFELRQKELRCAEQVDQWDRTESHFTRVVECLQRMTADVEAAIADTFVPPFSLVPTAAGDTEGSNPSVEDETPDTSAQSQAAAASPEIACKALLAHIDGALHQSAEHLEESKVYRDAMILRKRVAQLMKPKK